MPIEQDIVMQFLMWAAGGLLVTLVAVLAWVAVGVIRRLDTMRETSEARDNSLQIAAEAQFRQFGQQLASVQELVMQDIHKHDIRIVRLEEWRKSTLGSDD